jgi:hypothetical protein
MTVWRVTTAWDESSNLNECKILDKIAIISINSTRLKVSTLNL